MQNRRAFPAVLFWDTLLGVYRAGAGNCYRIWKGLGLRKQECGQGILFMPIKITLALLLVVFTAGAIHAQDRVAAEKAMLRLAPDAFPALPVNVKKDLQKRGCTIPQRFNKKEPHNVIRGGFIRKDQMDWAILCSTGGVSSILVYSSGSVKNVLKTAIKPDVNFLQSVGRAGIVYSRSIEMLPAKSIRATYRERGVYKPPLAVHAGIVDGDAEKTSIIRYYDSGKWLELAAISH